MWTSLAPLTVHHSHVSCSALAFPSLSPFSLAKIAGRRNRGQKNKIQQSVISSDMAFKNYLRVVASLAMLIAPASAALTMEKVGKYKNVDDDATLEVVAVKPSTNVSHLLSRRCCLRSCLYSPQAGSSSSYYYSYVLQLYLILYNSYLNKKGDRSFLTRQRLF